MYFGKSSQLGLPALALTVLAISTASSPAHADEPTEAQGWGVRGGIAATTLYTHLSYRGPSVDVGSDPDEDPAPEGNLSLSTSALVLGGEASFGVGYHDGRGNQYGLDIAALAGPVIAGGHDIPHTEITVAALVSFGPTYSRLLSPRLALDVALRASLFAIAGSQDDIGAYDNVFEFPMHVGFLGRLGATYHLGDPGHTALNIGLQGGPQFAGDQTAALLGLSLGIQFD